MTRSPNTAFDRLPELIARVVAYGLSLGCDLVITVDEDYKWMVRRE